MSDLQEIINSPIELNLGTTTVKVKKASIYDLALLQDYSKNMDDINPASRDMKMLPYALYICAKKVDSTITQENVNDMLPVSLLLEKPNLVVEIMTTLGFILPLTPNPKK